MSSLLHTLEVDLGERSYPLYIGRDLHTDPGFFAPHLRASQVVVVSNETVAPLYLATLTAALGVDRTVTVIELPDGEQYKTLATLETIFDKVMADNHNRTTTFIALGGGVVGDITGFAAACYQRGVHFIQVPTTLLSQVDSSVGGKTAVNHPMGKNMIGAFYQPQAVVIDIATLETLPDRELSAGMAEVIKYGLIADAEFYTWLEDNMSSLLARDGAALGHAIARSCAIKADIVAADEREGGVRALLNLGHTFGHAIETDQGYGQWLHGEAVAAGMLLALRLSAQRGAISTDEVGRLQSLLAQCQLPSEPPTEMSADTFIRLMARDKKVVDGQLRLILLDAIGAGCIVDDVSDQELRELLEG